MIVEIYKLDILERDQLIYLLKILAFNFYDCEIHPYEMDNHILIIVSSQAAIAGNFITSVQKEGFNCELLQAS
ncbi:hypothetical protein [Zunongwangia sp. HRR-M8]|uniref:hypothetical protein n=1 Tax=Zunongwangia sp. HRR-M8 TaxID=3015170 RepID=UPI0022DD843D|nr:hypothetical protein [Zunongwangia sp. HRR-M8]WBL22776.1 hypothetical protein PBT89_02165 [Zunongwangia sp. HRR-M8]